MSLIKLKGINVNYKKYGRKSKAVILLHGWGQNIEMMDFIGEFLKPHFVVYNFDLPGFGESDEPNEPWDIVDYTNMLHEFCEKKKIDNPIIIGHSFGCRIAVRYAYMYGAYKMVLTGAAGIRDKRTLKWYFKVYTYKLGKLLLSEKQKEKLKDKVGSDDYKNTSGVMRATFVKCVNDDTTPILKDVNAETLLVFGEKDDATPVAKGKLMEKLMPNAALVVFENDDHFAYFHQAQRFNLVLDAFFQKDYE